MTNIEKLIKTAEDQAVICKTLSNTDSSPSSPSTQCNSSTGDAQPATAVAELKS